MRRRVLATVGALALALAFPARAGDTLLPLTLPEKAALCMIETGVAILTDVIEHQGCEATKGGYDVDIVIGSEGGGFGTFDNLDLEVALAGEGAKGEKWLVTGDGDLSNVPIGLIDGDCANSKLADIVIGNGNQLIDGTKYRWKFIKDLYEKPLKWGDPDQPVTVVDRGLEVAMKLGSGWPRAKWRQTSKYRRPDGGDGKLTIIKQRIAPDGAPVCKILLMDFQADNYAEGFQVWGTLVVK